jgi:hypothetical protein
MSHSLAAATSRGAARRPVTGRAPARQPARPPRPTLRVVQAPAADRGRTTVVVLALLLLGVGLLTLLLINTALAQGSFRLHDLQATSDRLADQEQALHESIDAAAAPQRLAARARALGMVPSQSAAFIRLSDGAVLGVAEPAKAPERPTVTRSGTDSAPATATATTGSATKGDKAKSDEAKGDEAKSDKAKSGGTSRR